MDGILVYCETELREAIRARAYREHRSISDVGREALLAALTTFGTVEFAWYAGDHGYVIARVGPAYDEYWVFAWMPRMQLPGGASSVRIWSRDVAEAASSERWGCKWFNAAAADECRKFALERMQGVDEASLMAHDGTPLRLVLLGELLDRMNP